MTGFCNRVLKLPSFTSVLYYGALTTSNNVTHADSKAAATLQCFNEQLQIHIYTRSRCASVPFFYGNAPLAESHFTEQYLMFSS